MSTKTPQVDVGAIVTGAAGKVIDPAERAIDSVIYRATGYKMPWFTPAQVLAMAGPLAFSAAAAIQNLIEHHRFSVTNLWELLASSGLVAAIRLGSYLLKVLDPAVQPTEVAPVSVVGAPAPDPVPAAK